MTTLNRQLPRLLILAALAFLVDRVLGDLMDILVWGSFLSFVTWPLYERLLRLLGQRANLASGVLVGLLAILVIVPLISSSPVIKRESSELLRQIPALLEHPHHLEGSLAKIPIVGGELARSVHEMGDPTDLIRRNFLPQIKDLSKRFLSMLGGVGLIAGQSFMVLFLMFFLFRDGQQISAQISDGLTLALGPGAKHYLGIAKKTARAVLYGIVLTAIVQGSTAGLGYWVADMPNPFLLTLATIFMAMFPFGATTIWIPSGAWLLINGQTWEGIGLLSWGFCAVSWVDNLIRPIVISQASNISFVLIVFGLIGGLTSFGFLGLFLGPVILAIAQAAWQEWLRSYEASEAP